jgi:protoheme IX farnesyltransferase
VWPARYGVTSTKRQIFIFVAAFVAANALLAVFGYVSYSYLAIMTAFGAYWYWQALQGVVKAVNDEVWARRMFTTSLVVLLAFAAMLSVGPILH